MTFVFVLVCAIWGRTPLAQVCPEKLPLLFIESTGIKQVHYHRIDTGTSSLFKVKQTTVKTVPFICLLVACLVHS